MDPNWKRPRDSLGGGSASHGKKKDFFFCCTQANDCSINKWRVWLTQNRFSSPAWPPAKFFPRRLSKTLCHSCRGAEQTGQKVGLYKETAEKLILQVCVCGGGGNGGMEIATKSNFLKYLLCMRVQLSCLGGILRTEH